MTLRQAMWIALFAIGAIPAAWASPPPDDPPVFLLTLSSPGEKEGTHSSWIGYVKSGKEETARFELAAGTVLPGSFSDPRIRISHPSWASEFSANLGIKAGESLTGRSISLDFRDPRCPLAPLRVEVALAAWSTSPGGDGWTALAVEVRLIKDDPGFRWTTRDGVPLPTRTPKTPPPVPDDHWPAVPPPAPRRSSPENSWGFYLEAGLYFQSGDYGTEDKTRMFYAPFILGGWYDRFFASLTVPFEAMDFEDTVVSAKKTDSNVESGMGDIWLSGGLRLLEESGIRPYATLQGDVKIPTADEDRGLGTGEYDFGGRIQAGWSLGSGFRGYVEAGYGSFGEPSYTTSSYKGSWMGGVGAGWEAGGGHEIWVSLRGHTEIEEDRDGALMAYAQYAGPLFSGDRILITAGLGLADGSPDYLVGVSYRIYLK